MGRGGNFKLTDCIYIHDTYIQHTYGEGGSNDLTKLSVSELQKSVVVHQHQNMKLNV